MGEENRRKKGFYSAVNDEWLEINGPSDSFSQSADEHGQIQEISHCDGPALTNAERISGGVHVEITGRPPQNEDGVEPVCRRLALAIRRKTNLTASADGGRPTGGETGADWYIQHGDENVPVQVTRVGSQEMWAKLGRNKSVVFERLSQEMASEIARAIEAKRHKVDNHTILALDAGVSAGGMFEDVVCAWHSKYGPSVVDMRVREIWLVGYSPETTFLLR